MSGIRKPQPLQAHQGLGGRRNTAQASSQGSWGPLLEKAKQILPSKTEGKHTPFPTMGFTSALLLSLIPHSLYSTSVIPSSLSWLLELCFFQPRGGTLLSLHGCLPQTPQLPGGAFTWQSSPLPDPHVFGSSAPLLPLDLEADSFPAGFTQRLSIKEASFGGAACSLLHVALNTTAQGTGSTSFPF